MSVAVAAPAPVSAPWGARAGQAHAGRIRRWLPLVAVWLVSAVYVGQRLDRGWFPWDEGTLGHAAERVLAGELPHRDFDDVYTGGLAQLDATVFRVFGTRLIALRVAMFAVFLLWIPAVYYIATRFASPVMAAGVTLLCVVWSIPGHPAAVPSWYNLFLATFGTAALLRFTETRQTRWLAAAGLAGGLSVLVKIVGLYYIAGVLLFLAYDEHRLGVAHARGDPVREYRGYVILVTIASFLFVTGLFHLVGTLTGRARLFHFVVPGILLAALLTGAEWRHAGGEPLTRRVRRLSGLVGPFAAGVALPVALFLCPYIASGSVGTLVHGVFIEPTKRFYFAVLPPPPLRTLYAALPWLLVLVPPRTPAGRRMDRIILATCGLIVAALALVTVIGGKPHIGRPLLLMVQYAPPFIVAAGCLLLAAPIGRAQIPELRHEQLWLLLCMTAMCSLVQVPWAARPYYLLYFAPIAILTLLALVRTRPSGAGPGPAIVAGFFLVWWAASVDFGPSVWPRVPLRIPRTGLKTRADSAALYERVVTLLDAHSRPGGFIYAGPDCPQLYFLAQRRNPTRTLYNFSDEPRGHDSRVVRAIASVHVTAVAINSAFTFSPKIDSTLHAALRARFPDSVAVDGFVVRWRAG